MAALDTFASLVAKLSGTELFVETAPKDYHCQDCRGKFNSSSPGDLNCPKCGSHNVASNPAKVEAANFGGRTPYNLAWLRSDGNLDLTQIGTLLGPADPESMVGLVLADPTLGDWATLDRGDGSKPVLVALGGAMYPLREVTAVPVLDDYEWQLLHLLQPQITAADKMTPFEELVQQLVREDADSTIATHRLTEGQEIHSVVDFQRALEIGPYADGGYPTFFGMEDGGTLHFRCAEKNSGEIVAALTEPDQWDKQWVPAYLEINWEDPDLYCDACGGRIESAYAEPEEGTQEGVREGLQEAAASVIAAVQQAKALGYTDYMNPGNGQILPLSRLGVDDSWDDESTWTASIGACTYQYGWVGKPCIHIRRDTPGLQPEEWDFPLIADPAPQAEAVSILGEDYGSAVPYTDVTEDDFIYGQAVSFTDLNGAPATARFRADRVAGVSFLDVQGSAGHMQPVMGELDARSFFRNLGYTPAE